VIDRLIGKVLPGEHDIKDAPASASGEHTASCGRRSSFGLASHPLNHRHRLWLRPLILPPMQSASRPSQSLSNTNKRSGSPARFIFHTRALVLCFLRLRTRSISGLRGRGRNKREEKQQAPRLLWFSCLSLALQVI